MFNSQPRLWQLKGIPAPHSEDDPLIPELFTKRLECLRGQGSTVQSFPRSQKEQSQ